MLIVLFNLTAFEAVSQQNFVFPYTISESGNEGNLIVKDLKPTGLTQMATPNRFAHSFNANIRVFRETNGYDKIGGIFISEDETAIDERARFYPQEYNIRLAPRTSFNDIAYVPKSALLRLYNRIQSDQNIIDYMNSIPSTTSAEAEIKARIIDSIYKFMFPAGKPANNTSTQELQNLLRPGLLIVVGDYTTLPEISCDGPNPIRDNAAIYVIDAGSLQPLRMFKFFQCSNDIKTSNFTAIRYLDIIDRFVTVGSCIKSNDNTDILSFSSDLLYLAWEEMTLNNGTSTSAWTHRYDIRDFENGPSLNEIATGVDLRYFKKSSSNPNAPIEYHRDRGAIMVSGYLTNQLNQEISVLLRLDHDGAPNIPYTGRSRMGATNNRAHAVTFLTDDVGIGESDPADVGVTGYVRVNQVDNMYIAKFNHLLAPLQDMTYRINNTIEKPGFSIVSTGDGYAVTGRYKQVLSTSTFEHLSYLRVNGTDLSVMQHSNFPFGTQSDSYGQRMRFTNGAGLMLGGTSTLGGIFNHCSCEPTDPECNCTFEDPPCPTEWKYQTKSPLTLTKTGSEDCRNDINVIYQNCSSVDEVCWLGMNECQDGKQFPKIKPRFAVCATPLPNGKRSKLTRLLGDVCKDDYCKTRVGNSTPPTP